MGIRKKLLQNEGLLVLPLRLFTLITMSYSRDELVTFQQDARSNINNMTICKAP